MIGRASRVPSEAQARQEARELERLRAHNARLRVDSERYRKLQRSLRQAPAAKKAPIVAPAFQLTDPRRAPRTGEKVLAPLTPPLLLGRQIGAAVGRLLREMTIETRELVRSLARGPEDQLSQVVSAMDAPPPPPRDLDRGARAGGSVPDEAQHRLDALQARYRQKFEALAGEWSRRMIAGVEQQSTAQLSVGLKDMAEQFEIRSTMSEARVRAIVEASTKSCTQLIRRIPEKYLGEVQIQVMSAITTGSGLGQLVPYLTKRYKGDARHAHLTALDQVRKASENFNAARLQALGVEEYVWIHTGGERYPRKLHQSYSGRTFRYDDPPIIDERTGVRGKPGDAIGCRCRQRGVLKFAKATAAA